MLYKALAAIVLCLFFSSVGSAQVIFEPVASQYRVGDQTFYYGGSNPRVFAYVEQHLGCTTTGYLHRGLIGQPSQYTLSDHFGMQNAAIYGYTSVDARNDANANIPRFFRMADLLASAVPAADGMGVVVPAQAPGTIDIRPSRKPATAAPATQPRPVMIIPKKLLEPQSESPKIVTDAR